MGCCRSCYYLTSKQKKYQQPPPNTDSSNPSVIAIITFNPQIQQTKNQYNPQRLQTAYQNEIKVIVKQNLIRVKLPSQANLTKLKFQTIISANLYLYQNKLGAPNQIDKMSTLKLVDQYYLQFTPKSIVNSQVYKYTFTFKYQKQEIVLKIGKITIFGQVTNQRDLKFQKNHSTLEKNIERKIQLIIKYDYIVNILVLGRISRGKSTHIKRLLQMFKQLYGFQYTDQPLNANSIVSVTKSFKIYSLTQKNSICKINLIDGPGFGGQLAELNTEEYSKIFLQALNLVLKGELNYDQFQIPKKIDIPKCTVSRDQNKIIHYCLVFIDLFDVKNQINFITEVTKIIIGNQIKYGIVINKADQIITKQVSKGEILKTIQLARSQNYTIQGDHIFVQSLILKQFPGNRIYYQQFQRCVDFMLSQACTYYESNIVNVYMINDKRKDKPVVRMLHIKNNITLEDFITQTPELQKYQMQNIIIKYEGKDLIAANILNSEDAAKKMLYYYKERKQYRWVIEFGITN